MLPLQFFSQNLHFGISLFTSLVFFAMFWLYLDAWNGRKELKELLKWLGCLFLSLAFLVSGTAVEGAILNRALLGGWTSLVSSVLQVIGYVALIYGQIIDPLQAVPKTEGIQLDVAKSIRQRSASHPPTQEVKPAHKAVFVTASSGFNLIVPVGAAITAYLYWRRATVGLERHLKQVAIGFALIALSSFVGLSSLEQTSSNPLIYKLVASYGWLWWFEHIILAAGAIVLAHWVWQYLVKRIFSQVFMIFTTMAVAIFLATTISFSFLLVRSVQEDTLNSLENAANSLKYAIDGKKLETVSSAEVIAQNQIVAPAVVTKNHDSLARFVGGYLESKKLSSLIITTAAGQVLLRAEDPSRWGDSVSDDQLVRRAASGLTSSSVVGREDVLSPLLYFRSSVPIKDTNGQVVGTVTAGVIADTAFVDGIKRATGMDSSIYSHNVLSATTLVGPDGRSRLTGIKENNSAIENNVLKDGKTFKGVISLLNQPYLAVYAPLNDVDNTVAGMLFVGRPHAYILETAGRSIQITFVVAALLIIISIVPAYFVARRIAQQVS